tara:strand:- start:1 stop:186 length:186 start_codon:yes stop_codon:yes gene_type:complete
VFQQNPARNERLVVPSGKQNASPDHSGQEMGVFSKESVKRCENSCEYHSEKAGTGSQRPIT